MDSIGQEVRAVVDGTSRVPAAPVSTSLTTAVDRAASEQRVLKKLVWLQVLVVAVCLVAFFAMMSSCLTLARVINAPLHAVSPDVVEHKLNVQFAAQKVLVVVFIVGAAALVLLRRAAAFMISGEKGARSERSG